MASGLFWGLSWWPLKFFGAQGWTAYTISLSAYAVLSAVSLPLIWRERAQWQPEWRFLLAIGIFFGWANFAFTSALVTGSVVRAMLLFYLLPAWGAIGGKLFLHEHLGPQRLLAVALSLGGVAVILGGADAWRAPFSMADGMAITAGLAYTAAAIANRKAKRIPLASRTLVSFVGCTLLALLALPFAMPVFPAIDAAGWGLLLLYAFVWLLGATVMTTYGVTHMPASRAAVLQVVELLVAVVSAVLIGGEMLTRQDCIGGAMVLAATLIEARS